MTPEQQFELKVTAINIACGDIEKAKAIYAWLTESTEALVADTPTPKAEKAKTEKAPKAEAKQVTKPEEAKAPAGEIEQPALSYDTDVLPKIVATVSRLTTAGAEPVAAKGAIVAMMKERFSVSSAKDIPAEKWADLIAALDTVAAG